MSSSEKGLIIAALVAARSIEESEWCCGNEFAALVTAADDYYKALSFALCDPPMAVRKAIVRKAMRDNFKYPDFLLRTLQSNGDGTFSFMFAGMYHHVEPDGSIHT